jgi:hypothetical protein
LAVTWVVRSSRASPTFTETLPLIVVFSTNSKPSIAVLPLGRNVTGPVLDGRLGLEATIGLVDQTGRLPPPRNAKSPGQRDAGPDSSERTGT